MSLRYPSNQEQSETQSTTLSFQPDSEDRYFTLDSSTLADPADNIRGPPSPPESGLRCCSVVYTGRWSLNKTLVPSLDLKQALISCARSISDDEVKTAVNLMEMVETMVSVSGTPIQRLGAYLLEGLRARIECSGNSIYRKLRCDVPSSPDLMSAMHFLYEACPYWKFAYYSANAVITKAIDSDHRVHIIDFQIAQGSQWISLIKTLASRPGGPPLIRITGVDDPDSAHARGGGLEIVGHRLSRFAELWNVPFEFTEATMFGHEVRVEDLRILPGETLAVNFPYVLHHVPDEGVSTENHRDRLLRLVRGLRPKVVTLIEQESNTNTSPFYVRFLEIVDYYTAMFESIDAAKTRHDKQRIGAEQHCVARDIVNMVACEGFERVERHEPLGKWRSRLSMAGFKPCELGSSVGSVVRDMLTEYSPNYHVEERDGALYLGWKNRAMSTCSAWAWS